MAKVPRSRVEAETNATYLLCQALAWLSHSAALPFTTVTISVRISDIYSTSLYAACEGLPLWNPSVCRLGDVGFIRQGTFHTLYNVAHGPASAPLGQAATVHHALRTATASPFNSGWQDQSSIDRGSTPHSPRAPVASAWWQAGTSNTEGRRSSVPSCLSEEGSDEGQPGRPSSAPQSPRFMPMRLSPQTDCFPHPHSADRHSISSTRRSSPLSSLFPHSAATPGVADGGPPLPIQLEEARVRAFDMGPRMSTSYRSIGAQTGGQLQSAGVPVGVTLSFESSGGDGALLLAREPVKRRLLQHVGVLKAYLKAHRRFIHERYGQAEDVQLDELVLVYGQDCTSDWAVAVNVGASLGTRVDFEVFHTVQAGMWGNWKTTCTASQRGPYRGTDASIDDIHCGAFNDMLPPHQPSNWSSGYDPVTAGHPPTQPSSPFMASLDAAIDHASFSLQWEASGLVEPAPPTVTEQAATLPSLSPTWGWKQHRQGVAVDQSIVLRRITARSKLGWQVLPPRIRAGAGPRKDGPEGPDPGSGAVHLLSTSDSSGDPLDWIHEYIHQSTAGTENITSIASDEDATFLLKKALSQSSTQEVSHAELKRRFWHAAQLHSTVTVDEDGVATLSLVETPCNGSEEKKTDSQWPFPLRFCQLLALHFQGLTGSRVYPSRKKGQYSLSERLLSA